MLIGITGQSGSGKSLMSEYLKSKGRSVFDADLYARRAVEPETEGIKKITAEFGAEVLNGDGTLNRKKLADIVFSDETSLAKLNKTILPEISKLIARDLEKELERTVFLDAPTLFESSMDKICDVIVSVLADYHVRLERIKNRDNLDEVSAKMRLDAQQKDEFYIEKSDYIIYNNGGKEAFFSEVEKFIKNFEK